MPTLLDRAMPTPHLQLATTSPWPPYNSHCYSASTSSPAPMTPDSLSSYAPRLHDSPLPSQEAAVRSSGWFAPSIPAPNALHEPSYSAFYEQSFVAPQTSAGPYSPNNFSQPPNVSVSAPSAIEHPAGNYSPVSHCSRASEAPQPEFVRHSEAPSPEQSSPHLSVEQMPARPRSATAQYSSWTVNPLGISTPSMHQNFYSSPTFPPLRGRSPRLSEPAMELPSDLTSHARRMYAPIAPHPQGPRTSAPKRSREEDDDSLSELKKRKRSDSNTSATMELGDEDRLLIQLKDEESMPWKDIAARFQSDLGKSYQIPALQMRLKRLRERMRVWTDVDVKALRMAHEYWVQSKFDIIAQKMLEYGAAEKWTARQCARKWAEIDPGPTPYTTYEHHVPAAYAPYTMSPVEPHHFMPFVHMQ